jgi:hypothetical protein
LKALLHKLHDFPKWTVKPPLEEMDESIVKQAIQELESLQV